VKSVPGPTLACVVARHEFYVGSPLMTHGTSSLWGWSIRRCANGWDCCFQRIPGRSCRDLGDPQSSSLRSVSPFRGSH